jgi:hypothetical protein
MKVLLAAILLALTFCESNIVVQSKGFQQDINSVAPQTVTLYPPRDQATGKQDETRACFSFKLGRNRLPKTTDWDLGYGFASIGGEDWLMVGTTTRDKRSVMTEVGKYSWSDPFTIPTLEPLPELKEGERRQITVDSSGDTHKQWAKTTSHFVKAKAGYMYVIHVKDNESDFYVAFRVEEVEQGKHCTISWKQVATPEN